MSPARTVVVVLVGFHLAASLAFGPDAHGWAPSRKTEVKAPGIMLPPRLPCMESEARAGQFLAHGLNPLSCHLPARPLRP
jgi:hypothetical protein